MSSLKKTVSFFCTVSVLFAIAAFPAHAQQQEYSESTRRFFASIGKAIVSLEDGYYGFSNEQKERLFESFRKAINKETQAVDQHTFIMDKKGAARFMEEMRGTFAGIGTRIGVHPDDNDPKVIAEGEALIKTAKERSSSGKISFTEAEEARLEELNKILSTLGDNGLLVGEVFPGSPADKAGIQKGWTIHTVDGKPLVSMLIEDAGALIRGPVGTAVTLGVIVAPFDPSRTGLQSIVVTRGNVVVPQLISRTIEAPTAEGAPIVITYVRIVEFAGEAASRFETLLSENTAKALIIDVRGNLGGSLGIVDAMLERLMPPGLPMLYVKERHDAPEKLIMESIAGVPRLFAGDLVVLTDGNSASASEILAGVLRDHNLATLIGGKTLGKGSVQTTIPLANEAMLKVTEALYVLPSKEIIDGKGIEPHIAATDDPATEEDEVLQAAVNFLVTKQKERK